MRYDGSLFGDENTSTARNDVWSYAAYAVFGFTILGGFRLLEYLFPVLFYSG